MKTHRELLDAGIRTGHAYLESFKELEEDWDGEGAKPVPPEAIELAHKVMDAIGTDKFVYPDNEGAVEFEWDVNDKGEHLGLVKANSGTFLVTVFYIPKKSGLSDEAAKP